MQTKLLMGLSALFMALLGLVSSFGPHEILSMTGSSTEGFPVLIIQITGALYLGFAMLNWMARGVLIGGIYSRPLAMGNFMHFAVVTIVLSKSVVANYASILLGVTLAYGIFTLWFGLVLFTHPGANKNGQKI